MPSFHDMTARYPRIASLRTIADAAAARSAWLIGALFLLAGVAVLDDYGMAADEIVQRRTAQVVLDYARGRSDALLHYNYRTYGMAVEAPLWWAERALNLQDSRAIYLLRHLLTHLLFLAGGLGAAALAFRLYGSRRLALGALGLFLLHPRLYAHSFFNSKDLPFLSLFMLALLLTHWACRRGTGPAFLLCGIGVGVLANVRPMGLLLFGAVLTLRACDFIYAPDRTTRRRVLRASGLFVGATALTLYALWPYLWSDPVRRGVESLAYMAEVPHWMPQLVRGHSFLSTALPPEYAPVWFAITAPPPALGFGLVGLAALARRAWRRPGALLRHTRLRFEGLLLACCILPVLAVILLDSTLYNGWRHLYFLYAPFCLLAIGGLHALATAAQRRGGAGWTYGLAGAGAGATLAALVSLHPYQHLYFNFLVDRATPERLLVRYDLDYWQIAYRDALEFLLARYPDDPIRMQNRFGRGHANRKLLPATDRQRLEWVGHAGDFFISDRRNSLARGAVIPPVYAPVIHTEKAYGSTILDVAAVNLAWVDDATAAPYRAAYRALRAREPAVRDRFDVYLDADAVSWVQAPCQLEDTASRFLLHVTPAEPRDLRPERRARGFNDLSFRFNERGVRLDGACLAVAPRPAYPIRHLTVGQSSLTDGSTFWQSGFILPPAPDRANAYRAAYRALTARAPTHRAVFDVYLAASTITFAKTPCTAEDAQPRFILRAAPANPRDLPDRSFGNLDFFFPARGVRFDRTCLAAVPRPAYPLRSLTIGQWRPEEERTLWKTEIPVPPAPDRVNAYRAAYRALPPPTHLMHRDAFGVYLTASRITLAKAPCTAADTQPKFILHAAPANPRDLPGRSFGNLDFFFPAHGVRFERTCLASVPRPAYPLRSLTIGQWRPEEKRMLWKTEIPVPPAPDRVNAYRAAYRALTARPPTHRAAFNVYVTADAVAFAKAPCTAADTQPKFFLHAIPVRTRDLPPARRAVGFDNRDFEFAWQGAHFNGACLARARLPAYPVKRLRVGQFRAGEEPLWAAELPLAR